MPPDIQKGTEGVSILITMWQYSDFRGTGWAAVQPYWLLRVYLARVKSVEYLVQGMACVAVRRPLEIER